MERIIASKDVYSPIAYLEGVTGKCYLGSAVRNDYITYDIDCILQQNGFKLKHFPMNSIERAIAAKRQVVLVDCSHYEGDQWVNRYYWYQISDNFNANPG